MKVTAQEEYGLRCLLQLAKNAAKPNPVTVRQIATIEGLSNAYAEKLLRILSRAGLAKSLRGTRGGYRISRAPESVTVGDVFRALGGVVTPEDLCSRYTGKQNACMHKEECGLRPVWSAISTHLEDLLDQVPLSLLLESECSVAARLKNPKVELHNGCSRDMNNGSEVSG